MLILTETRFPGKVTPGRLLFAAADQPTRPARAMFFNSKFAKRKFSTANTKVVRASGLPLN